MTPTPPRPTLPRRAPHARGRGRALAPAVLGLALAGCLGEPRIEDRWTRIDLRASSLSPGQTVTQGATLPITVDATITYRSIVTGFAVAELRSSAGISPVDVTLDPQAARPAMAADIDRVLAGSVTRGRATRAITGWDHLIQEIPFTFDGVVPTAADSASGLFLVVYLGSGERMELADGRDSVVVTPFPSGAYEILPIGLELTPVAPGSRP